MDKEQLEQLEWVKKAQLGKKEYLEKLLEAYGYRDSEWTSFLGKYLDILLYGKINLKDKDTRRFLQLYMKDPLLRSKLNYRYRDYVGELAGQEVATYLQNKVEIIEEEDLKQQLVLIFIESVMRYKQVKKNIGFNGYLYNIFRFRVYELLRVNVFKNETLLKVDYRDEFEDVEDPRAKIQPTEAWLDRFYASELNRDELGIFWINGRCGTPFKRLTTFERTLLRDRYLHKKTDGEIAKEYGYHINTIYNRRHKAIQKLEENIKETLQ